MLLFLIAGSTIIKREFDETDIIPGRSSSMAGLEYDTIDSFNDMIENRKGKISHSVFLIIAV